MMNNRSKTIKKNAKILSFVLLSLVVGTLFSAVTIISNTADTNVKAFDEAAICYTSATSCWKYSELLSSLQTDWIDSCPEGYARESEYCVETLSFSCFDFYQAEGVYECKTTDTTFWSSDIKFVDDTPCNGSGSGYYLYTRQKGGGIKDTGPLVCGWYEGSISKRNFRWLPYLYTDVVRLGYSDIQNNSYYYPQPSLYYNNTIPGQASNSAFSSRQCGYNYYDNYSNFHYSGHYYNC